jgi:hypothetical protein
MSRAQFIYHAIPTHVKRRFENGVVRLISNLIDDLENMPFDLSSKEKDFLYTLGSASGANEYCAVYEAFGMVLLEFGKVRKDLDE